MDMKSYIESVYNHTLPFYNELPDFELYMDQVISLMDKYLAPYIAPDDTLTPSMINNYVKMSVLPAPTKKRYSKEHLARLIVICLIKRQLSIPTIAAIMNEQIEKNGIEKFFDSFKELYEKSMDVSVKKANEEKTLLSFAMELAINASAHHAVAENAVYVALPPTETKKEKKEKKKN